MKHRSPSLLYFSLDPERCDLFWKWVRTGTPGSLTYTKNAQFQRAGAQDFHHAADLSLFLGRFSGNLQSLHVVMDLESVPQVQMEHIRAAIVQYPEVQFLFDRRSGSSAGLLELLFPERELLRDLKSREDKDQVLAEWKEILASVRVSLAEISWEENEDEDEVLISRIICGMDNTFDANNLRYALKFRKYLNLKVDHTRNFSKMQDSRRERLAVCIEEETRQNILISYILYANGYRVLPITTRHELELLGEPGLLNGEGVVLRDYDLQFEDEDGEPVDEIRGYKYVPEESLGELQHRKGRAAGFYKPRWNDFTSSFEGRDNRFWKAVTESAGRFPVYFVTNGPRFSRLVRPGSARPGISPDGKTLLLPGLSLPVCGIYRPFHGIREIRRTYQSTRYSPGEETYRIRTSRKNHDHSTPLDIYETVNSMIRRAEAYFEQRRYILATLVAGEAIEYMNGFHHRLMINAYFIQAKAENAIAMDVMGSNEHKLARDAEFRVSKIREDIARFYYGLDESNSMNVLSQIFSDCRLLCKELEHFESEDVFISAMSHLLEGFSPGRLLRRLFGPKQSDSHE